MPTYVLLSTLTSRGAQTIKAKPGRIKEVNKEIAKMGGKISAQYAVLGPYDFLTVLDAANNETVARISLEIGARGSVKILTLSAVPIDKFINSVKK